MLRLALLIFALTSIAIVNCAQVHGPASYYVFPGSQTTKTQQQVQAVLRLLADVGPKVKDGRLEYTDELDSNVCKAIEGLQERQNDLVAQHMSELVNLLSRTTVNTVVSFYLVINNVLSKYSPTTRQMSQKDREYLSDSLRFFHGTWEILGDPTSDMVVFGVEGAESVRKYIQVNGKRLRLSHCITSHMPYPYAPEDSDIYSMVKVDLNAKAFQLNTAKQQKYERMKAKSGDGHEGCIPEYHTPHILVYVLDKNETVRVPKAFPEAFEYEKLRLPLYILYAIFDDIEDIEAEGNIMAAVLKSMRRGEIVDNELLGRLNSEVRTKQVISDLIKMLPDDYVQTRVSMIVSKIESMCVFCGEYGIMETTKSYQAVISNYSHNLSGILTNMARSVSKKETVEQCNECNGKTTHDTSIFQTFHLARHLIVKIEPNMQAEMDFPVANLVVGDTKYTRLIAGVDREKEQSAWIWLEGGIWLKVSKSGMQLVRTESSDYAPFYFPELLVYRA